MDSEEEYIDTVDLPNFVNRLLACTKKPKKGKDSSDDHMMDKPFEEVSVIGDICDNQNIASTSATIKASELNDCQLRYKMQSICGSENNKRGKCIIFNQDEFHPKVEQSSRTGSRADAIAMEKVMTKLKFEVEVYHNRGGKFIMGKLNDESQSHYHNEADCLAIVFLSHGFDDQVFAYDCHFPVSYMFDFFKGDRCPSLRGKPKLFFIQACRGDNYDKGTRAKREAVSSPEMEITYAVENIPIEADQLFAFSTVPGYFSWRSGGTGSWFIEKLAFCLDLHGSKHDLVTLLTMVNRIVAYEKESRTQDISTRHMKQCTQMINQLTKRVVFY